MIHGTEWTCAPACRKQELAKEACGEWSDRCEGKRVKAPKGRQDYEFEEKSEKDFEIAEMMERLQNSMGGMGGGMGKAT